MVVPVDTPVVDSTEPYLLLRNTFLENLSSNGNYDDYEQADIDRIRNDDKYCQRFILHKKGNFQEALDMVDEALKWRKSFGVKDVNASVIPLEFFEAKGVFPYNTDKEGNPIIMILVRFHKKGSEYASDMRKFVIYWVELMEEQTKGGLMSVVMSCEGAGLSHLDLDLIKFLITLFRSYYPHSLAHILIYEMPWILQPAWKIIKAWLPLDFVEKIKFVNKTSIREFVNEDSLPLDMGGTCTYEYEHKVDQDINSNNINGTEKRAQSGITRSFSKDLSQVIITDDYTVIGGILKISPATKLVFDTSTTSSNDFVIKLTCCSDKVVSYKVKTNNISSYRVKPSLGTIEPGNSIDINVILLPGFHPQQSDKFLIMAMEVSDPTLSGSSLNGLWKSSPPSAIADHKLKCVSKNDDQTSLSGDSDIEKVLKNINLSLSNIESKVAALESRQTSLHIKQNILLFLTFTVFIFLFHMLFSDVLFKII